MEKYRVKKEELFAEVKAFREKYPNFNPRKRSGVDNSDIEIPDSLGLLLHKMIQNCLKMPSYGGYSQSLKEDMYGCAIRFCLYALGSFDIERENAVKSIFSYFTAAITSGFKKCLTSHYKQCNLRQEMYECYSNHLELLTSRDLPDEFLDKDFSEF